MTVSDENKHKTFRTAAFIFALTAFLLVIFVRVRLLDVPLERDEGEYAYIAQLMLHGEPPYRDAYTMKFPGTPLLYAFFMSIFGRSPVGIHLGLLVVNALSCVLLYRLGRNLKLDRSTALIAAGFYSLLSLSQSVLGVFAHATHFVIFFALAGILAMLRFLEENATIWLALSGLSFGTAVLMKQHAALFVLLGFVLLFLYWPRPPARSPRAHFSAVLAFTGFSAAPLVFLAGALWRLGIFNNFYFWSVQYALEYAAQIPAPEGIRLFLANAGAITAFQLPIWILAALGCIALLTERKLRRERYFMVWFIAFSFLAITPGLVFREHYFILILPAVALLSAQGISFIRLNGPLRWISSGVLALALAVAAHTERDYFFTGSPNEVSRAIYGANPFPEARFVAALLVSQLEPEDRILVLGSEPQIYFYTNRRAATGYIYMYGLMESHPFADVMQDEMISQIEKIRPPYIVLANVSSSWGITDASTLKILIWSREYLNRSYEIIGYVESLDPDNPVFVPKNMGRYGPLSENYLAVYKRLI